MYSNSAIKNSLEKNSFALVLFEKVSSRFYRPNEEEIESESVIQLCFGGSKDLLRGNVEKSSNDIKVRRGFYKTSSFFAFFLHMLDKIWADIITTVKFDTFASLKAWFNFEEVRKIDSGFKRLIFHLPRFHSTNILLSPCSVNQQYTNTIC
jgi:hypothetical protein